ncbi:GGDEF domain-containing response regulator [Poseidonibacter ostreae]|uniref:diguanylate cyclase n=1 Tax=Poseidonibacter ostreae TaxID=2654171 RepID=A0A6L4WMW5_9BACT|nr:diguanylate cyclase [Poseidonibacter ostreae]KAB7881195.1 diguanylate cyclase [Poseidonibacter ostreae]KAB7883138.1 diguanylate cyclase [Poseidonibacter ostreae]KAB7886211.1 diguanylate cyclase [Poseidonibacter ostreae]
MKTLINKIKLENKKVLYVEDDDDIRESTIVTLKLFKMDVIVAKNGLDGIAAYKENQNIDVLLTDIKMPKLDGLSMIEEIKKFEPTLPTVVVTGHTELNFLRKAIELGVSSYVNKPIDIYQLRDALIKSIEPYLLKTMLLQKNKELEILNKELELKVIERTKALGDINKKLELVASTDFLTNIPNRKYIFELGEKLISISKREKKYFSVLLFDIDFFKKVNDTYGHQIGDEVLKFITSQVTSTLRESDTLGRIGGEEFLILLNGTSKNGLNQLSEKIRLKVQNNPYKNKGILIPVTISIGIASLNQQNNTLKKLYIKADNAMYQAKKDGRNCIRC